MVFVQETLTNIIIGTSVGENYYKYKNMNTPLNEGTERDLEYTIQFKG